MDSNTMMRRPQVHDLVKEAMEGTAKKVDISAEAMRQFGYSTDDDAAGQDKTAAAAPDVLDGEFVEKMASALDYIADELKKEGANPNSPDNASPGVGPGQGNNPLQVLKAEASEENIDAGEGGKATDKNQQPKDPALQSSPVAKADPACCLETNDDMQHGEQPVEPVPNEKASIKAAEALFAKNLERVGIAKQAQEPVAAAAPVAAEAPAAAEQDPRYIRRALLGNTLSTAIEAQEGKKLRGAGEALAHSTKQELGGVGLGGAGGAGLGALASLASRGKIPLGAGAGLGAIGGSVVGGTAGAARGRLGQKATEIHGKYAAALANLGKAAIPKGADADKDGKKGEGKGPMPPGLKAKLGEANPQLLAKNLARIGLSKQAEDAINPANISGGAAPAKGADAPPGASEAEKGPIPAEPSDVNSQKGLIGSNQAAIDYTKRDAKKDPKKDLGAVLTEPALSASTDKTLARVWDKTEQAGAKIAGDLTRTAAAQALLAKLAEANKPKDKDKTAECDTEHKVRAAVAAKAKGKGKESMLNPGLATPAGQTGRDTTGAI